MNYELIIEQIRALLETDRHYIPVMSNVSALLMEMLEDLNWVGFYIMREGRLVVGPFQGKVACIHIEIGKGVCGTAAKEKAVQEAANKAALEAEEAAREAEKAAAEAAKQAEAAAKKAELAKQEAERAAKHAEELAAEQGVSQESEEASE